MTAVETERTALPAGFLDSWLSQITVETGLLAAIGLGAAALRLFRLGDIPLSTVEAREALSAWRHVSLSSFPAVAPSSPALAGLMMVVFWLFGASEFWARFWPAMAGVTAVFMPLSARRYLGRGGSILAVLLLAISPTMLAASRTADGTMIAAAALMIIGTGLRQLVERPSGRGWLLAGIGLGLGLADGPQFYSALGAGIAAFIAMTLLQPRTVRLVRSGLLALRPVWQPLLLAAAVAFTVLASAGFMNPGGFSAAGGGLLAWIFGWLLKESARPIWIVPLTLGAHEPLLVIVGAAGLYWAFLSGFVRDFVARVKIVFTAKDDLELEAAPPARESVQVVDTILVAAVFGTLLYGLGYPGRAAADGVWIVFPLAVLSGRILASIFSGDWFEGERETVLAQAGVLFVMLVFVYFHLGGFARNNPLFADRPIELRLYLAGAVIGLGIFVTVMFALGWTSLSAVRGAALALAAATAIGTVGSGIALTTWRATSPNELWTAAPTQTYIDLMMQTVHHTSLWTVGDDHDLEVAVVTDPSSDDRSGLLGWELRGFPRARFVDSVDMAVGAPLIIVDSAVADPRLNSGYAGEQFPVLARQSQAEVTAASVINWWLYRQWPTEFSKTLTLWVRQDVHNLTRK
jgi:hypothetical protein